MVRFLWSKDMKDAVIYQRLLSQYRKSASSCKSVFYGSKCWKMAKWVKHKKRELDHHQLQPLTTINRLGFETLKHSAYSPDLAPSNIHTFGPLKKALRDRGFTSDMDIQECDAKIASWPTENLLPGRHTEVYGLLDQMHC